jgi:Ca2+-binding RTX toxin-like protein
LTVLNAATLQGLGITATGAGTNTIQLSGIATWAAYQAALDLIGFSDPTDHNPGSADRHIDVTVNDGFKDSNVATTTVHFTAVDELATFNPDTVITNFGNNSFTVKDAFFLANDSDPDSTLGIGGVGSQNSLSANHSNGNQSITITDSGLTAGNPNGGSFSYSGSGTNSSVSATVTLVEQSAAGNLTATNGSGQILVDNNSAHTIIGGAGNDFLIGNGGADTMTGGAGSDTFVFNLTSDTGNVNVALTASNIATTLDHITDFTQGSDKIDLSAIDANTASFGDQAFQWDGAEAANNHNHIRGHVGFYQTLISGTTHTIIEGNTSIGNAGGHDFQIDLTTAVNLTQNDFVL